MLPLFAEWRSIVALFRYMHNKLLMLICRSFLVNSNHTPANSSYHRSNELPFFPMDFLCTLWLNSMKKYFNRKWVAIWTVIRRFALIFPLNLQTFTTYWIAQIAIFSNIFHFRKSLNSTQTHNAWYKYCTLFRRYRSKCGSTNAKIWMELGGIRNLPYNLINSVKISTNFRENFSFP